MRKWSWIGALLTLVVLTIGTQIPVVSVEPAHPIVVASGTLEKYEQYGPRIDHLNFSVWGDVLSESEALDAGDIDVMDWPVPGGYVTAWDADPNITIEEFAGSAIYFHALNNQMWPIGHGEMTPPGWTGDEPAVTTGHYWINYSCQRCLDARQFRRALAHLTDRAAIVANMEGFVAEPVDTFIPPILDNWKNPNVPKYPYSLTLAEAAFLDGGFADWDSDMTMEYSPGHDGVVIEELPTIMGWIRSDDPDRTFASIQLRDDLLALRVPLDMPVVDRSTWYYHTYVVRDYHISADGLSSIDPRGCYEIFYSRSESHIGYHSEEFDYWFEKLLYATTMEEAFEACLMCQWIIARDVASIPTCALWGYWAHRTNYGTHAGEEVYEGLKWEGFVNELGASFPSFWTYLNVHPQGFAKGGTLRQGLLVNIEKFNPVHAEWFYDWLILQQIYEPLIANHPYDVTEKIPWLCSNWTAGTWELEGENCTRLRFKLLPSILWHDETPVTLDDVGFSFTYMQDEASVANYWAVQNFYGYLTADNASNPDWDPLPGPGEIDILYDVESWHALEWAAGVPIIPKHIWEGQDSWTWNPEDHGAVIGSGPFMAVGGEGPHEGEVGWPDWTPEYVHLVANPLYHRRYVWPDATNAAHDVMARDNVVTRADYDMVRWPDHKDTYDPRLYPLLPAWDTSWMNATTGDHYLDVDKNGAIDVDDLLEISVRYGQEWPPPWYLDC